MATEKITFSFGENWADFIARNFSPQRVDISRQCLLGMLERPDLQGQYFLDLGCGSGLSSLAAFTAGAARIVSFDIDPHSVATTRKLWEMHGSPAHWEIHHGSALDRDFLATLEPADIAYSWGVLHHTGQMWQAIRNAAPLMKPDGVFFIALYTTTPSSPYWLKVKRRYNAAGNLRKRLMEWHYVLRHMALPDLICLRNPWRRFRDYQASRGMSQMTDVRDWLGGYPYEDASVEQVLRFGRDELGLELVNLKTGEACTEYVFCHPDRNPQWRRPVAPSE